MVNKDLIYRKIKLISKDLKGLKQISYLSEKEYVANPIWEIQVERHLERIIGRMIDINYHIITEIGDPPPSDYFESFVNLGKLKVLPKEFSQEIASYAGLRNRLVHEYNFLDEKKIYQAMKKLMKDIPKYFQYIEKYIEG